MANYKKQKTKVKQAFTFKGKFYKIGDTFENKKPVLQNLKQQNLIE